MPKGGTALQQLPELLVRLLKQFFQRSVESIQQGCVISRLQLLRVGQEGRKNKGCTWHYISLEVQINIEAACQKAMTDSTCSVYVQIQK